jgi:DNA-binding beta-propeller fold protein YncE
MTRVLLACTAAALVACVPRARAPAPLPPLADEGQVLLYLEPFPEDAARLSLSFGTIALGRPDGAVIPLEVVHAAASGEERGRQRLLAWGRVPAGDYDAIVIQVRRATLTSDEQVDLVVPKEPVRVGLGLAVLPGSAFVLHARLGAGQARAEEFEFRGDFSAWAGTPASAVVPLAGYVSVPRLSALVVYDRRSRGVTATIPTGLAPAGVALDPLQGRGYVALAGEDQLQLVDLGTGADLRRLRLRPGDAPGEAGLTPDGRLLVVVNGGSNSVSFVDAQMLVEVGRVPTGQEPGALLLDRAGRRAWVLDRRSNDLVAIDLGNQAVVGTAAVDPEPLRASLGPSEDRLYLVCRGSAFMKVLAVPGLTELSRIHVGLGASAVKVDPRTGLVFVGYSNEDRLQVFDPVSLLPMGTIPVPGPVSYLTIDDVENALLAVIPEQGVVAVIDLAARRVSSLLEVPLAPLLARPVSERN